MRRFLKNLIVKIKKKENWFFFAIYSSVKVITSFHIPVVGIMKPLFMILYSIHVFFRQLIYWVARFFYNEPLFRSQCVSVGEKFVMDKLPFIQGMGDIYIGNNVTLSGKPMFFFNDKLFEKPRIKIGNQTFISHETTLIVAKEIIIGNNCLISVGVTIVDNDSHPIDYKERREHKTVDKKYVAPVCIGDDVWIGHNASILKGVTIGNRSIIGARAVVTKSVPDDCIVAGNPARIVKNLKENGQEQI